MKKFALAAGFALLGGAAMAADPIEGIWQTQPDDGAFAFVTIKPCGPNFCGNITKTFKGKDEYDSPNLGKPIVIDMAPQGGGRYEGKVWRPSNNKIYMGKVSVNGKAMSLSGCVAGGLICKSQDWVKVK
ncbi:DUF2147 domain-containing protein [Paracoccus pacificus]|uniref:DUF2147 domain-containing protein n=1 Tax=Paracoccus pacificus TaxID=1463598 RepID=A0ABW4RB97_9RHOB